MSYAEHTNSLSGPRVDYAAERRAERLADDAAALCDDALKRAGQDTVTALYYVNFKWRSIPDVYESDLIDEVTAMLRQIATPTEWHVWKIWCESTADVYVETVAARHARHQLNLGIAA